MYNMKNILTNALWAGWKLAKIYIIQSNVRRLKRRDNVTVKKLKRIAKRLVTYVKMTVKIRWRSYTAEVRAIPSIYQLLICIRGRLFQIFVAFSTLAVLIVKSMTLKSNFWNFEIEITIFFQDLLPFRPNKYHMHS